MKEQIQEYNHREVFWIYEMLFWEYFMLDLKKYFSLYGFDVIKFSQDIGVPDDKSTFLYVKEKYGKKAVKLIKFLLKINLIKDLI